MKMKEAADWVKRITYKPGWAIATWIDNPRHMLIITIATYGPTVDDPLGLPVRIENRTVIHASELEQMVDPSHLMPLILSDLFHKTEMYILEQWLRIDGQRVVKSRG